MTSVQLVGIFQKFLLQETHNQIHRGSNNTEHNRNNCNSSHAQNTAALQPDVFKSNISAKGKGKNKVHPRTDNETQRGRGSIALLFP